MRVLLDTDILIDVALQRTPFVIQAIQVVNWAEDNPAQAGVAWHSLSNIAYLVRPSPRLFLEGLLRFVEIAPVGTREARQAMGLPMNDLEDAMQAVAALAFDAHYIVTRNLAHFRKSPIPALSPSQFLKEAGR